MVAKREVQSGSVSRKQAEAEFAREQQKVTAPSLVPVSKKRQVQRSLLQRLFRRATVQTSPGVKPSTPNTAVQYPVVSTKKQGTAKSATGLTPLIPDQEWLPPVSGFELAADQLEKIGPASKVQKKVPQARHAERVKKSSHRNTAATKKRSAKKRSASVVRPTIAFAILAVVFILPASVSAALSRATTVQRAVAESGQEAFAHLYQAGVHFQNLQFDEAKKECDAALLGFTQGQEHLSKINPVLTAVAQYVPGTGKQYASGVALLDAGQELALAGQQLSSGLAVLSAVDIGNLAQQSDGGLTQVLEVVHSSLAPAAEHLAKASKDVQVVSIDAVPKEKQQYVLLAQQALPEIESAVTNGVALTETLLAFLGHQDPKKYVVLFQNNYEMRPTGGFIGSLALVNIDNGSVKTIDVPAGGVYDISGQLTQKVISPQPLHVVNPLWNLQDANWFPQFPASAQKIEWFLQQSKVDGIDGVITVVPSVIEKLLTITGPLDLVQDFGVTISAENFYTEVQNRAEEKYDVTRESKKIIGAMTPLLLTQLFQQASTPEGLLQIIAVLRDSLAEKNILVYMNDPRMQADFSSRDWTGELKTTDRDYLGIFHANIGGGKTDGAIENSIKHTAHIAEDGSIVNTVTLTRIHKGETDEALQSVNNLDYVRFYVPQGSTLLAATGFVNPAKELFLPDQPGAVVDQDLAEITGEVALNSAQNVFTNVEFEKTVFGGWIQTSVGNSASVTLQYRLPFSLHTNGFWDPVDHYSLLVQKQPGSFGDFFTSAVVVPENLQIVRTFPSEYTGQAQTVLSVDQFMGMVVSQK